ncbi:MAG: molybdate ABC transporter substrate-binding protein [Beijerinckiaceae bacterium]
MSTIRIMSGGAAQGLVKRLVPELQAATGCHVDGVFSAVGGLKARLLGGERADIAILTAAIIAELETKGVALAGESRAVGGVSTAVAIRTGDPTRSVGTAEELKAALLAATDIHFPDPQLATAGIHFASVLRRLGIFDETASRHRVFSNGATAMAALAASTAANPIGCTQLTEIVSTPGITSIGDLPGDLGLSTTYTAALLNGAENPEAARWLIARLADTGLAGLRRECGFA